MGFDNEYEFIPLAPMTYNSIPQEMKDFIGNYGMFGMTQGSNFNGLQRGFNLGLKVPDEYYLEKNSNIKDDEDEEDEIDAYIERNRDTILRKITENCEEDDEKNIDYNLEEFSEVEKILKNIDNNNPGIFKFLELNGIPYNKAKKYIKRVVRLTLMYK